MKKGCRTRWTGCGCATSTSLRLARRRAVRPYPPGLISTTPADRRDHARRLAVFPFNGGVAGAERGTANKTRPTARKRRPGRIGARSGWLRSERTTCRGARMVRSHARTTAIRCGREKCRENDATDCQYPHDVLLYFLDVLTALGPVRFPKRADAGRMIPSASGHFATIKRGYAAGPGRFCSPAMARSMASISAWVSMNLVRARSALSRS